MSTYFVGLMEGRLGFTMLQISHCELVQAINYNRKVTSSNTTGRLTRLREPTSWWPSERKLYGKTVTDIVRMVLSPRKTLSWLWSHQVARKNKQTNKINKIPPLTAIKYWLSKPFFYYIHIDSVVNALTRASSWII